MRLSRSRWAPPDMAGIERRGEQLGSIRVDEPKPKASKKTAEVVEDTASKVTGTAVKKADTK